MGFSPRINGYEKWIREILTQRCFFYNDDDDDEYIIYMGPKQLDFNPQTETVVAVTDVKY